MNNELPLYTQELAEAVVAMVQADEYRRNSIGEDPQGAYKAAATRLHEVVDRVAQMRCLTYTH